MIGIGDQIIHNCEHGYKLEEISQVQWNKDAQRVATMNGDTCTLEPSYINRLVNCGVKNGGHTLSITTSIKEDSGTYTCVIDLGPTRHSSNSLHIYVGGMMFSFSAPFYHFYCLISPSLPVLLLFHLYPLYYTYLLFNRGWANISTLPWHLLSWQHVVAVFNTHIEVRLN